jgi:RNA polymerase sigma-70 factor (ECF subfamily)
VVDAQSPEDRNEHSSASDVQRGVPRSKTVDRTPGDDEALLSRAVAGDSAALGELLTRNESRVRALLAQMVGPRGRLDDLVQEVRLKAVRGLASFRGDAAFSTWLHRIAVNTAI